MVAALDDRDVPALQGWVVGGRRPVLAAHVAGADVGLGVLARRRHRSVVVLNGLVRVVLDRLARLRVEPGRPGGLLHERQTPDELAVGPVDGVAHAVAVGFQVKLARLAVHRRIHQHVLGDAVVVVRVVRRVLVVPLDLARIDVHRERAVGVEVVAGPVLVVPVRAGVADAPDQGVGLRVVAACDPGRAAAVRGRALVLPGLRAGLAGRGDGVGAPDFLVGVEVGRRDPAADAVLGAGNARDREVLDDERSARDHLALVGIGDLALPGDLAGVLVGGDDAAVQRVRDDLVAPERHAAVVDAAARDGARPVVVGLGVHLPDEIALTAVGVDLVDGAPAVGDVHEAVLDDGRALKAAVRPDAAALDAAERYGPSNLQVLDVAGVDLVERREPLRRVAAVVEKPVPLLARGVEQAVRRHVAGVRRPSSQSRESRAGERERADATFLRHLVPPVMYSFD